MLTLIPFIHPANMSAFPRENIIQNAMMEFHSGPNPSIQKEEKKREELQLFPSQHFGIFTLTIADTPMITQNQVIDTSNDMSGSMSDLCADSRTKMKHVTHTLENLISALSVRQEANVTMATYGFDDRVEPIFEDTKLTEENANELRSKLSKLQPRNGTNLYQSLEMQKLRTQTRFATNPHIRQTNITLTDGQANEGTSTCYNQMASLVPANCNNIFIGFGKEHNAPGLKKLADAQPNGSYFYIAEIEKGGLVFGEIIHQLLYTALTDITIQMTHAEIYDYRTNQWQSELHIPSIVSEATKIYHIRAINPEQVTANIVACSAIHAESTASTIEDDIIPLPGLCQHQSQDQEHHDLGIYMIRQRTQEIIFQAHEYSLTKEQLHETWDQEIYDRSRQRQTEIRELLTNHIAFMKTYAQEKSLTTNETITSLITDLTIILHTFGGNKASMYSAARGDSQGRQTSNQVSYICPEDMCMAPPRLKRQNARGDGEEPRPRPNVLFQRQGSLQEKEKDEEDQNEEPEVPIFMQGLSRCNTTPKQKELMRDLSMGSSHATQELDEMDLPI